MGGNSRQPLAGTADILTHTDFHDGRQHRRTEAAGSLLLALHMYIQGKFKEQTRSPAMALTQAFS